MSALHEVVDAQILVVGDGDAAERYQFRHALVQEAAYEDLLPRNAGATTPPTLGRSRGVLPSGRRGRRELV